MADFTIEGRGRYFVLQDGVQVSGPHSLLVAEDKREAFERSEGYRERPCITCRRDFLSQGAHNRMCPCCRRGEADNGMEA